MGKVEMKVAERSLLLYLETCAVDHTGRIDPLHLNAADWRILARWEEEGFVRFGRVESAAIRPGYGARTHWVRLSDEAWAKAHELRRQRADRTWEEREWRTTSELQGKEHVA